MKKYIHTLRQKPEHVRKQIAVVTTAGITALVGIIWVTAMAASGSFSLTPTNSVTASSNIDSSFALDGTSTKNNFSQLIGAVGAAAGATTSKPTLRIIDGETRSSFTNSAPSTPTNPSATVLTF